MNRKTSVSVVAAALLAAPICFASPAMATEDACVPTPAVEAVFELKLHVWTGGPSETAPDTESPDWNATNGEPNGGPHSGQTPGVPYQTNPNGNGNWFVWLNVEIAPAIPAVECPPPAEEPEPTPVPDPEVPVETPEPPVNLPEVCPAVVLPEDDNIGAISLDCPVTLPKPEEPETTVGPPPVERPAKKDELPHTGSDDVVLLALAGLGLIGLGAVVYHYGRRP